MKKIIRLTEEDLHRIVKESVQRILSEDGEGGFAGGGGATNAAGVMQGGGINPGAGQYDVPAFAKKKQKKVGGNAFDQPIRKPSPVGEPSKKAVKGVDMSSALSRGGSISVNHT